MQPALPYWNGELGSGHFNGPPGPSSDLEAPEHPQDREITLKPSPALPKR